MHHRAFRLCSELTRLVGLGPRTQFKSCLTMAGLNLTAEELEVLAVGYANPEDPTLRVHYTCVPIRSVPPPPHSHSLVESTERGGTTDDATRCSSHGKNCRWVLPLTA